jgi:membrane dipeptidase
MFGRPTDIGRVTELYARLSSPRVHAAAGEGRSWDDAVMQHMGRIGLTTAALAAGGAVAAIAARTAGHRLVARTERRLCVTRVAPPYTISDRALAVHAGLDVVDLHADSLLWGRDLSRHGAQGQVDVPRLIEGNVAIQALAASTHAPRHLNIEANDGRTDDMTLLAIGGGWPPSTWRSRLARALYLADRALSLAAREPSRFQVIRTADELTTYRAARALERAQTATVLAIEGAHALDDDPANVQAVFDAGFRMMSPSHFYDNAFGGSAHGLAKGGLTAAGREMVERMEALGMIVDVAHASAATIDDVLAMATRPVVASHTGVRGVADNARNLSDAHLRGIAATGGLVGIGFWDTASGGEDVAAIAQSIAYGVDVAGVEHVGLGSDFDGAVTVPFDATGMALITEALLAAGLDEPSIAAVMGGNAMRVLAEVLP